MNRTKRLGRLGGLAASAVAATPFAWLWVLQVRNAKIPPTPEIQLDMAIWMAVLATPWMLAAWLLWRAWWRRAGARLSALDGPGWLLAAATATLPADRRRRAGFPARVGCGTSGLEQALRPGWVGWAIMGPWTC
jgi:hypothetical protein